MKPFLTTKNKQANETLKKSAERAQLIFENMRAAAWLMDMNLKTTWASPSTVHTQGFKPEELQGSSLDRHLTPASMTRLTELIAKHISPANLADKRKEVVIEGDFEFYRKDGTAFWGDTVATLLRKRDGAPVGFLFVVRDVTERTRAEEALSRKHIMLARTEGIAHIGSWEWDIAKDRVTWSNELFRIFQRDPREGAPSFAEHPAFYHPDDMARLRQAVEAAAADGTPYELELRAIRKDGETRVCVARGVAEMAPDGRPVRLLGSLQDISERSRAEATIQASEARYRLLVENANEAIVVAQDGLLKFVNQRAVEMTGYSETDLLSRPFSEFIHPDDREMVMDTYRKRFAGETALARYDFRLLTRDGGVEWVEIGAVLIDWEGRPATLNFLTDITDRHRGEESIQESLREKEVMLREIHHRVKNNMQVISSLFNLQAGKTVNLEYREILKEGQTRIRAMSLVHEKLYQTRNLSKIDLAAYVQSLAAHLFGVYLVDSNRIRLETDLEGVPLDINSAVPCGLILNELISNSLKHAFPEGRKGLIRIGLKLGPDDMIILRVADDGIGFPKDIDFLQSESLGIQIANLLVGQLEGTIELDRTNGTAFTVTFHDGAKIGKNECNG